MSLVQTRRKLVAVAPRLVGLPSLGGTRSEISGSAWNHRTKPPHPEMQHASCEACAQEPPAIGRSRLVCLFERQALFWRLDVLRIPWLLRTGPLCASLGRSV